MKCKCKSIYLVKLNHIVLFNFSELTFRCPFSHAAAFFTENRMKIVSIYFKFLFTGNGLVLYYFIFPSNVRSSIVSTERCGAINICMLALADLLFSLLAGYYSAGQFKGDPDFLGPISCK